MIDAIQDSIPMPVSSEAGANAGSKTDSSGFSFTDALDAVVDGGKPAEAPAEADAQPTQSDDPSAMLMGLAGAGVVQMASVLPLQVDPAASELAQAGGDSEIPTQSVDITTQPVGISTQPVGISTQSMGQQIVVGENQPSIDTLIPGSSEAEMAAVEPQSAAVGNAPATATSAGASDPSVVLEASKPVQTSSSSQGVVVQLASDAALQANPPVVDDAPAAEDSSAGDQAAKARKSEKAGAAEPSVVGASATRVPVEAEAVTVQWQFDGSSRTPGAVTAQPASQILIGSAQGSETKPSGGETRSSTGQQSPDPQAAAMGMQQRFNVQTFERSNVQTAPDLHVRVIDQVVRQVSLNRIDGGSNLVVKLNPPDLGSLRLQITQDATGMTTHIQTANSQVRGLLEAHMPLLMDSLAKAGVQMDSVSVSVGTSFNAFAQNARHQDAQPNSYQSRQMFATGREMGGIQTIADAAMRPTWGSTRQAGYSWLA